jgi:hypothetical protein
LSALSSVICIVVHRWHHIGVFTSPLHLQCGFNVCGCIAVIIAIGLSAVLATALATNLITRRRSAATANAALTPMPLPPQFSSLSLLLSLSPILSPLPSLLLVDCCLLLPLPLLLLPVSSLPWLVSIID